MKSEKEIRDEAKRLLKKMDDFFEKEQSGELSEIERIAERMASERLSALVWVLEEKGMP